MTAPAHPVVFRPIIRAAARGGPRGRGHRARLRADARAARAARASSTRRVRAPRRRVARPQARVAACRGPGAMRRFARGRRFDLAVAHGSNDLALAAALAADPGGQHVRLRVGDAAAQHRLPARAARDDAGRDPARAPAPLRRRPRRSSPSTRGSRRSTTSRTSSPTAALLEELGLDREKVVVIVRPPPDVSLYHRKSNPLFPQVLDAPRPPRGRPGGRAAAHRRPARVRACARAAVGGRPRRRPSTPRAWSRSRTSSCRPAGP